jgi:hypothetical protein
VRGLVPRISIGKTRLGKHLVLIIEIAGTSPAMTVGGRLTDADLIETSMATKEAVRLRKKARAWRNGRRNGLEVD